LQFRLNLFDCGQRTFHLFGKPFQTIEYGNAHGRSVVPERVLRHDAILGFAEDEADARTVIGMAQDIVNGGQVEVHFPGVLGLEARHLEIDDAEASKLQVVEEQVELEIFSPDFERNLAAHKGEADSQFDQELAEVHQEALLQVAFPRSEVSVRKSKL
jgi:hypothetical protein